MSDFSDYTYEEVLSELQTRLAAAGTWSRLSASGVGETIMEAFAFICDVLHYNLERRVEENYLPTAKLRSSVVALAKLVGYTPRRRVSSVGWVKFSLTSGYWDAHGVPVDIPAGTVVSNGSTEFVTTEGASLGVGIYETGEVSVKQGESQSTTQTGTGLASQYVDIPASGDDVEAVEDTSVEVFVDDVAWTEVDSFYDARDTDEEGNSTGGVEDVDVSPADVSQQIAKRVAALLKLQAIEVGDNPQAFINDKLMSTGEALVVTDGMEMYECEVVEIRKSSVTVRCREAEVVLKLVQATEQDG